MYAQKVSRCEDCGQTIHLGQPIRRAEEPGSWAWVHVACPPERKAEVCSNCWLEKPCECDS